MNVAIIGCNGIGRLHARMAANCGLKVVACADKYLRIAKSLAKEFGAEATSDCLGVVKRPDVDIVGIMTPTPDHITYIEAAAAAGKHMLCEKPLCRTLEECRRALAAAKRGKVKLFVGHVVRYFHAFETVRAQIAAGKVGKAGFVKMYRGGNFPTGVDGWFSDYAKSGGVTLDSMIHDMDWLRYVFGEPDHVFCQTLQRTAPELLDYSMATFRMKSGVIAKLTGTWANPSGFRAEVEVCGDQGMVQFSSEETPLTTVKRTPSGTPSVVVPSSPVDMNPYQLQWQDFLGWLDGKQPRVMPEDAVAAVKMGLAALKSAETGKRVKI